MKKFSTIATIFAAALVAGSMSMTAFSAFPPPAMQKTHFQTAICLQVHNYWRMDTRDFSHERKCAIPPFFEHTFAFLLFCVIIILRRQRTDAAGTDH